MTTGIYHRYFTYKRLESMARSFTQRMCKYSEHFVIRALTIKGTHRHTSVGQSSSLHAFSLGEPEVGILLWAGRDLCPSNAAEWAARGICFVALCVILHVFGAGPLASIATSSTERSCIRKPSSLDTVLSTVVDMCCS